MLAQLIAFCEVAHKGSFRAAADGLNISQPALTLRVQKLEEQLRFQLFNRERRGVQLTPEGERFLPFARSAIQAVRDGQAEARRARSYSAVYRIMSSFNLLNVFVLNWVRRLQRARPDIAVSLDCGYPDLSARLFSSGLIDLAVTYEPISAPGLASHLLYNESVILVTSCDDVEDWRRHYVYAHWDERFAEEHRELLSEEENNPSMTIYFLDALRAWALSGPASGYMAEMVARPYLADGRLRRVPGTPVFQRPVYASRWLRPADDRAHEAAWETLLAAVEDRRSSAGPD